MTYRDIITQIISEASGRSISEISNLTDIIFKMAGKTKIDQELSDDEASEMLKQLRSNLPGVQRWLVEGGLMVEADFAEASGSMH